MAPPLGKSLCLQDIEELWGHMIKYKHNIPPGTHLMRFITLVISGPGAIVRPFYFNRACVSADAEQCLSTEDFGKSYRGTVYYTQHYLKCIPWDEAKHCDINPFDRK